MITNNLRFLIILMIISFLSACNLFPVKEKTVVTEPVVIIPEHSVETIVVKAPEPVIPEQQDVLILLSHSSKTYQKIASYLVDSLGEHVVQITLSGLPAQDNAVIKDIKVSSTVQIVAVGLKAVNAVRGFKNKQVIYTEVLSHKKLTAKNVKGVSSLPSPEKLFRDWKKLSPNLSKVAILTGGGLDLYLDRAKKAANKENIELIVEQVNSDKGFIYKSKKLKNDVVGLWILPDNRILSGKALKEVMSFASRRGKEIVVFSPKLLSFGGFFYVAPDPKFIASGILKILAESAGKATISGDSVLPIMSHTMGINQNIARQFDLAIPQEYRKYINGK